MGRVSDGSTTGGRKVGRRWATDQPVCALCAAPGSGRVAEHHLTHGVSVLLCGDHRSDGYQRRRDGQDFANELAGLWSASGCLSARHRSALAAHVRRVSRSGADRRSRPGSYSWPVLRAEAERRFAAGESPRLVIHELRAHHAGGDAIVPSVRTMRRWFCEARWLTDDRSHGPAPESTQSVGNAWSQRIMPLSDIRPCTRSLTEPYGSWALSGWSRGSPKWPS